MDGLTRLTFARSDSCHAEPRGQDSYEILSKYRATGAIFPRFIVSQVWFIMLQLDNPTHHLDEPLDEHRRHSWST